MLTAVSGLPVVVLAALGALAGGALRVALARPPHGIALPTVALPLALAASGALLAGGRVTDLLPGRWLPMLGVLAVLTVGGIATDVAARRLPDRLTVPALLAALGAAVPLGAGRLAAGVAAGALLAVLFGSVRLVAPGALGGGDVKVSAALGVALGALVADAPSARLGEPGGGGTVVLVVLVALGLPVVASTLLLVVAALRRRRQLPYGPALLLAAWVELVIVA